MKHAPVWTEAEFELVLKNPNLPPEELTQLLPTRSTAAITIVRDGIHNYHQGGNISMLSKMMVRRLDVMQGTVVCPKCKQRID